MFTNRAEFIERFLHQLNEDWTDSTPPDAETMQRAVAASTDEIGFDAYRAQFTTLTDIMDACAAEGLWGGNPVKHPRVLALAKLEPSQRAMIVVAAAQGLVWMDQCEQWIQRNTPRQSIGLGVMAAVLLVAGRIKGNYSAEQLAALARLGALWHNMDDRLVKWREAATKRTLMRSAIPQFRGGDVGGIKPVCGGGAFSGNRRMRSENPSLRRSCEVVLGRGGRSAIF